MKRADFDSGLRVTTNFVLGEFFNPTDPGLIDMYVASPVTYLARITLLANALEKVRAHFNQGKWKLFGGRSRLLHITSGGRTKVHNALVGGAEDSQHLYFKAADFWIEGVEAREVATFCDTLPEFGGVGTYDSWTHGDVRNRMPGESGEQAQWEG